MSGVLPLGLAVRSISPQIPWFRVLISNIAKPFTKRTDITMHFEFVNYSTVPIPVFANAKIYSGDVSQFTPIPPNTKLSTAMVWVSWGLR